MAAEAVPHPSVEAQHQDEYIDYSEDDAEDPAPMTKGSNDSFFPADAHLVTVGTDNAEMFLETENQTFEEQAAAETVSLANDAQSENIGQVLADTDNSGSAASKEQDPEQADSTLINENEINWEDGPVDDQTAADQVSDHHLSEKGDWELVDEDAHLTVDEPAHVDGTADEEEKRNGRTETPEEVASVADGNDFDPQGIGKTGDDASPQELEDTQDTVADGDLPEIDYFEDGNAPAEASAEAVQTQAQAGNYSLDFEDPSNAQSDQDIEGRAMDEATDSISQHGSEKNAAAGDDAADDEDLAGKADNEQIYVANGEDMSANEHMEYDDEILADARSLASVDTPPPEDIPVITVAYKGVEYPFFYNSSDSEGKQCFFDDLSLLHCKMEGVLAGFRRELDSELGPLDELVFQIEELGLEFAESSQPEVFSDITLGQIISVFDSLVKNQDPDASKPLYAFLLTRPNCKKRWLSLVDDAYNGKGLDEVTYYFSSQAQSEAAEPEILDDEPDMIGEEDNADAAAWPNSPVASEQGCQEDEDDVQEEVEHVETNDVDSAPQEADFNEHDDVGTGVTDQDATQTQNTVDEDTLHLEPRAAEDLDVEATMADANESLMEETIVVADDEIVEGESMIDVMEGQNSRDFEENAPEIDISNPLVNWDTDEADLLNGTEGDQYLSNDEDGDRVVNGTDENSANKVTPNTSATSTLAGDEVANENNELDLNADMPENEDDGPDASGHDDELGEIDWREFPGQGDDEITESPSVVGKRQRSDVDDLLDDEDEKDVKRRRS